MKTPEEMATEYARTRSEHAANQYENWWNEQGPQETWTAFLAGYKAAKDEEATKDQKIAALWTESIKNMLPSVHKVVLFPSDEAKARKAKDAEIVTKMDAAINRAKDEVKKSK